MTNTEEARNLKLSIVIVNYNVRYFLEQCLSSVRLACQEISSEVFVIDNNSVDGSVQMVREKFPEVHLIANDDNRGFSRANNQGIRRAVGDYVLLLNPDTVVEEDTFSKIISFMDTHPDAGGLGVKMLDGKGIFLPESKRGLPTPSVAFYKIFGLARLFPSSPRFGHYHLTYLDRDKVHPVDILAGAFMLIRKEVLDRIGLLDESFFMYGEDIDLSYRITQAGYKNYYFPETRIIHYKGESTRKGSLNYVILFYNSMKIFAQKHYSKKNQRLLTFFINVAIYFRAFLAIIERFLSRFLLPLIDALFIYAGISFIKWYWEYHIKVMASYYPAELMTVAVPFYILTWLISVMVAGGYKKPIKFLRIIKGVLTGTMIILVIYALLPEQLRFSRALILLGTGWALTAMGLLRILLHFSGPKEFRLNIDRVKRFLIVGEIDEADRVNAVLKQAGITPGFVGYVKPTVETGSPPLHFLGAVNVLPEIAELYKIDEVIFCARDIPSLQIMDLMTSLEKSKVSFKIAPPESTYIIGSNSIHTPGELYVFDINAITRQDNRRKKRLFDGITAILFIILSPFLIFYIPQPHLFLKNILLVLLGRKSWVGYCNVTRTDNGRNVAVDIEELPLLKQGVLHPGDAMFELPTEKETIRKMNMHYARDYKVTNDLRIIWFGLRYMGRKEYTL